MIPISKPKLSPSALKNIVSAFKDNDISQGKFVTLLERKFQDFTGQKHASACANGTLALYLALRAMDIEDGEVIMPTLTFAATADAVIMAGAKPVFCDIDPLTWSLDTSQVYTRLTAKTRAIITVDLYGKVSDIKRLRRFNLPIIRDAAESLGANIPRDADVTTYSFFGNKVMTSAEGGMCVTDSHIYKKNIDELRNHGRSGGYWHVQRGTNARMSNIHAAIGVSQLDDLPKNLKKRERVMSWYGFDRKNTAPWLAYTPVQNKEKMVEELNKKGIGARVGFYPLHTMPAYKQDVVCPVSEQLGQQMILLPCYPDLTKGEVQLILKALK